MTQRSGETAMAEEATRSRLGRGLAALIGDVRAESVTERPRGQRRLPTGSLRPNARNPRRAFSDAELDELTASLRERGIIQPIIVRPAGGGGNVHEIIAGERRWRAAQRAGLTSVPALVKSVPDQAALALALIENIQREDLNPLEEAQGLQRLIDEFGLTHDAAAKAVGRTRSAVTNLLRLRELAKPVQEYLLAGQIDMGHARTLLSLSAGQQVAAAARVVAQGLSVRETERLAHRMARPGKRKAGAGARPVDPDLARLTDELADALGAKVAIEPGRTGAGRVVISYSSLEQLDGILARLR
jgi:ParB family chromosome partitioning protein